MELKEFSHKGEAIEKEIKKEFQFMGRTIKKRRVGLIIAAAGVIAVIAVALFIHSQQFDVWDSARTKYISAERITGISRPPLSLSKAPRLGSSYFIFVTLPVLEVFSNP